MPKIVQERSNGSSRIGRILVGLCIAIVTWIYAFRNSTQGIMGSTCPVEPLDLDVANQDEILKSTYKPGSLVLPWSDLNGANNETGLHNYAALRYSLFDQDQINDKEGAESTDNEAQNNYERGLKWAIEQFSAENIGENSGQMSFHDFLFFLNEKVVPIDKIHGDSGIRLRESMYPFFENVLLEDSIQSKIHNIANKMKDKETLELLQRKENILDKIMRDLMDDRAPGEQLTEEEKEYINIKNRHLLARVDLLILQTRLDNEYKKIMTTFKHDRDVIKMVSHMHMMVVEDPIFTNGNGRMARIIMNVLARQYGLPAVVFHNKKEYQQHVHAAIHRKDRNLFVNYVRNILLSKNLVVTRKVIDLLKDTKSNCRKQQAYKSCLTFLRDGYDKKRATAEHQKKYRQSKHSRLRAIRKK